MIFFIEDRAVTGTNEMFIIRQHILVISIRSRAIFYVLGLMPVEMCTALSRRRGVLSPISKGIIPPWSLAKYLIMIFQLVLQSNSKVFTNNNLISLVVTLA